MAAKAKYDWPPIEGVVAFTKQYGVNEAAGRLGVPAPTLRSHLAKHRISAEEYAPRQALAADALKEIAELVGK